MVESARRKKDEANRAQLERLKQARIEAHQERMALQRKMKGMGGRSSGSGGGGGGGGQVVHQAAALPPDGQQRNGGGDGSSQPRGNFNRNTSLRQPPATGRSSAPSGATSAKDGNSAYLEQLRLARVEAFEARKALAMRHEGARRAAGSGAGGVGVVPGMGARQPQQPQQLQSNHALRSGSTSEQVLQAKHQRKAEEQARHERMLSEARKAAYAERQALEAKMRNGGTTPRR